MEQEIALAFAESWYLAGIGVLLLLFGVSLLLFGVFFSPPEIRPGFFIFGGFMLLISVLCLGLAGFQLTRLHVAPELAIRKSCR